MSMLYNEIKTAKKQHLYLKNTQYLDCNITSQNYTEKIRKQNKVRNPQTGA